MTNEDFLSSLYSEIIPNLREKKVMTTEQALFACYIAFDESKDYDISLVVLDEILKLDPNDPFFSRQSENCHISREEFVERRTKLAAVVEATDNTTKIEKKIQEANEKRQGLEQTIITGVIRDWMVQRIDKQYSIFAGPQEGLQVGQRVLILPVMQTNLVREINILERDSELYKLLDKWRNFWEGLSLSPQKRLAKVPPDTVVVEPDNILERDSDLYKLLDDLEGEEEVAELFEGIYRDTPRWQGGFPGQGAYDIVEIDSAVPSAYVPPTMRGIVKAVWLESENEWDSVLEFFLKSDT